MDNTVALLLVGAALGLVLGLLGGGGGILAVPLLVAVGEPVLVASTMSLVIVGSGAGAALVPHHRAQRVDWPVGLTFGGLGAVGAVLGARIAQVLTPAMLLAGLGVLLVFGSYTMLRTAARARRHAMVEAQPQLTMAGGALAPDLVPATGSWTSSTSSRVRVVALASGVGLVTGLFGVGAGFVVVPALVSAMKLPVKKATATGLVVIVINSAVALAARHSSMTGIGLTLALAATSAAFAVVGALVSRRIPGWVLSAAFGALMVLVAVYTLFKALSGS